MEIEKIVDPNTVHPIALKYADAILAGMPPKQADIQRMAVTKMCELLFAEAEIQGRLLQINALAGFLRQPLTESNLIWSLVGNEFQKSPCDFNPLTNYLVRPKIQNLPISLESQHICEILFQFFENGKQDQQSPAAACSADQV